MAIYLEMAALPVSPCKKAAVGLDPRWAGQEVGTIMVLTIPCRKAAVGLDGPSSDPPAPTARRPRSGGSMRFLYSQSDVRALMDRYPKSTYCNNSVLSPLFQTQHKPVTANALATTKVVGLFRKRQATESIEVLL